MKCIKCGAHMPPGRISMNCYVCARDARETENQKRKKERATAKKAMAGGLKEWVK